MAYLVSKITETVNKNILWGNDLSHIELDCSVPKASSATTEHLVEVSDIIKVKLTRYYKCIYFILIVMWKKIYKQQWSN